MVGVCFVGKAESATFEEIVEEGGFPRCVVVAANTARNYNYGDLKCNFAWSLASAIHVTGRIGEEAHQITAREFAELLDRSGVRPVVDVAEVQRLLVVSKLYMVVALVAYHALLLVSKDIEYQIAERRRVKVCGFRLVVQA